MPIAYYCAMIISCKALVITLLLINQHHIKRNRRNSVFLLVIVPTEFLLLPPFHNVNHSNFSHINIDVYMFRFINININVRNTKMTYIVKRREYRLHLSRIFSPGFLLTSNSPSIRIFSPGFFQAMEPRNICVVYATAICLHLSFSSKTVSASDFPSVSPRYENAQ